MTTYFLDSSAAGASDSNAGTSAAAPFRSLAALNSRTFQAGDTVSVKAGTSYSGTLSITEDGTASAPITFNSYGSGSRPTISTTGSYGIDLAGANHIVVDGLHVTGPRLAGVRVGAGSNNNQVKNLEIDNAGSGLEVTGQYNLFTGNQIHDLKMIVNTPGGDDDYGANGVIIYGSNNEFAFNKIWNARASSYDYGRDGGGFEFWATLSNIKIHDNWVQDSEGFFEVGGRSGDRLSNVQINNNVDYNNNGFQYIHVNSGGTNFGVALDNIEVANNTIVQPNTTMRIMGFSGAPTAGEYDFHHNIVYAPKSSRMFDHDTGGYHHDNFYSGPTLPTEVGRKSGDPGFVSLAGADFHLQPGSAAAGAGAYSASGADFLL